MYAFRVMLNFQDTRSLSPHLGQKDVSEVITCPHFGQGLLSE